MSFVMQDRQLDLIHHLKMKIDSSSHVHLNFCKSESVAEIRSDSSEAESYVGFSRYVVYS